jgi:hypothetical protein
MKRTKIMKTFSSILLLIFLFLITGCTGTVPTNNAPMINSIPINSSLVGVLYTYNVEATDTDGDTLTYSLTSNPTGMTIDSSTGIISWTPDTAGDYSVTLKVSDGELFDTQSFTITISLTELTTPSPPTNVSASDGSYTDKVQITWNTVTGASHYQVYRALYSSGLGRSAISGWQTGTSYDDTGVTKGDTYYYWLKAATGSSGDNASDFSASNSGYAAVMLPIDLDPPTGVSASDGTYTDKVRITWNTVTGASHYRVYRSLFPLTSKIAISGWQTGTSYDDTSVTKGDTYYYWLKAATSSSGDNASDFSASNSGYAAYFILP